MTKDSSLVSVHFISCSHRSINVGINVFILQINGLASLSFCTRKFKVTSEARGIQEAFLHSMDPLNPFAIFWK